MRSAPRLWSPLGMLLVMALLLSTTPRLLPRAYAAPSPLELLDDSTFVSAPGFDHAAIQTFLSRQPGALGSYRAMLDGTLVPASHIIAVASMGRPTEVSPRVMLTLLELAAGLVSAPNPPAAALEQPFALGGQPAATFAGDLFAMGGLLRESFAAYDATQAPRIRLADGSSSQRPPLPNAATYALEVALGQLAPDQAAFERLIGDGEGSFRATYRRLFGDAQLAVPQAGPQLVTPFLYQPFEGVFPAGSFFDHDTRAGAFVRFDGKTNYGYDGHDGTDYPMGIGNPVVAAADGVVVDVARDRTEGSPPAHPSWCPSWASYAPVTGMAIRHSVNGVEYKTWYWHLASGSIGTNPRTGQPFQIGDTIARGERVGLSGNTGCSSGPHLHFGVQRSGRSTDPYGWCGSYADPYPYPSVTLWAGTMTNPSPCPGAPVDTTPPLVSPAVSGPPGAHGWYTGPVNINWSLSDPESGIAATEGCANVTLSQDTGGTTLTCTATNGAGLRTSESVSLKIDATPPVIDLAFEQAQYTRLDTAIPHISAHDPQPGSGLASLEASFDGALLRDGQTIELFWRPLGTSTMQATARDHAGLSSTRTASFELIVTLESLARTIAQLRQRQEISSEVVAHDLLVTLGWAIAAWQRGENDAAVSRLAELEAAIGQQQARISARAAALLTGDITYLKAHLAPRDGLPQPPEPPRNLVVRSGRTALLTWEPSPSAWSHGYHVYRQADGEATFIRLTAVPLSGLSYSDTSAAAATTYTYYVTAVDEFGRESAPSNSDRAYTGRLRLQLPAVRAAPGTIVRVPVQVEYADGLCLEAVDVGVSYDPAIATPVGVSRSALTDSYSFAHAIRQPGEVHISAVGPCSNLYGAGALFWVNFAIAPTTTVQSSLEFVQGLTGTTIYDSADLTRPIPLSLRNGAITVDAARPQLRGDLNGDGVINAADAALVLRIAVGLLIPNADQRVTGDVNADGTISAADATMILYYAAHQAWPVARGAAAMLAVAADQPITLQVAPETTAGVAGAEVRVPVTIDEAAELAGTTLLLQHGPGLIYRGASVDPELESRGFQLVANPTATGEIRLGLAGGEGLAGGKQRLMWLRFQVAETATDSTTWMQVAGAWINDQAGRDFSTSGMQRAVSGGRGIVTLSQAPTRVFLPLIQR